MRTRTIILSVFIIVTRSKSEDPPPPITGFAPASKNSYRSYQSSVYCSPAASIEQPHSVGEVQQIVKDAIKNGKTVKAIGSRHSLTDVICTDGIPISMLNINYMIANNDDTATVGGGAEMKDLLEFLHARNKTLIHVPTFGGITVGGAIGTGAHGSSLLHPTSLSDQIVRLTIVDGLGEIRVIDDPQHVNAFRVHLGLLGVIMDVTIKTVPLFKMTVKNQVEGEAILFDGRAIQWAKEHDWLEMWYFPSTRSVVVSKGNYTTDLLEDQFNNGNATTNLIPDQTSAEILSARDAFETLQGTRNKRGLYAIQDFTQFSLYQDVVGKPAFYSENGGRTIKNPATGYGWQLQSNKCINKCPWDNGNNSLNPEESAMAFDLQELPGIIKTIKSILSQVQTSFSMIGIFIRFSKSSDALMAITSGRESVHVEWATPQRRDPYETSKDGIAGYQAILQAMVKEHGGRPHWGKNGLYYSNPEIIKATSPNRETFIKYMKTFDPQGIFLNKFGRRLLGISKDMDVDPKVKHCALQDYCVCSKNSDCATFQQCTQVKGYQVCNDIGATYLPSTLRNYNPTNLTSIYESIDNYYLQAENIEGVEDQVQQ